MQDTQPHPDNGEGAVLPADTHVMQRLAMTTQEMTLTLDQFGLPSSRTKEPKALRMVLKPGELLRMPRKRLTLRVFSGDAWVSQDNCDHILRAGDTLDLPRAGQGAVLSAEGKPVFFELA